MAKVEIKGIEDYLATLDKLGANTEGILKQALYAGAGMMADEVKREIQSLPSVPNVYNIKAFAAGEKSRLSHEQKEGLLKALGIAPFEASDGGYQTKIGFDGKTDGYNTVITKKYPQGQPNQMIARALESGSSYMDKSPFMRRAKTKGQKKAEEAMRKILEDSIEKIVKE